LGARKLLGRREGERERKGEKVRVKLGFLRGKRRKGKKKRNISWNKNFPTRITPLPK